MGDTAIKNDQDKTRFDLVNYKQYTMLADIFTFGAKQYGERNYLKGWGLDLDRVYAALERHVQAWRGGEVLDPESGFEHILHAAACCFMISEISDMRIGRMKAEVKGHNDPRGIRERRKPLDVDMPGAKEGRYVPLEDWTD